MATWSDPAAGAAAPHVCPQCPKTFPRLCDLNKHAKSHTRPYKCKDPACKYSKLGWPTAKELERHHNDKHSASPRTFPCLFQPCPYWSKRESNCKQHMEKVHDWEYARSKSKGRRSAVHLKPADRDLSSKECGIAVETERNDAISFASPHPIIITPPDMDFVLFGEDHADAVGEEDDSLYHGYGSSPTAESYLPWTSPTTRLRNNQSFLEVFSQTYNGEDKTSVMAGTTSPTMHPILFNPVPHGAQDDPGVNGHCRLVGDVAIKVESSPVRTVTTLSPKKRKHEAVEASPAHIQQAALSASGGGSSRTRRAGAGQTAPTPSKLQVPSKQRDSSGEGSCRQIKRSKPNPAEDFTDTSMPDIFRFAHPHIYDRNQAEKYSPCHTVHREISTLVRHLSRPAHRLKVTDRTISSFDVEDPNFRHPRAGVCRSCWQTFSNRTGFDAHVARPCEKVSKGKREKWRVLFECFTPLLNPVNTTISETDSTLQTEDQWERLSDHLGGSLIFNDDGAPDEIGTPPTSVPSPTLLEPANFGAFGRNHGRFVSAYEHHRLQEEHQVLRERHQQLEQVTQALFARQLVQETINRIAATNSSHESTATNTSRESNPTTVPGSPGRDGLVQHMDSQSTDVDVQGFMAEMENARQSLSRMNSGLSTTSRSTIHRVPPSPPPRAAELPDYKRALPGNEQAKHDLSHRSPPPSIPDSGYGTEQRRGSLGDTRPMTPPSSRENEDKDKHSSHHHPQPGFLIDHEMADYDDASYNLFYQDNSLVQTRSSPPGFTFEFTSQVD